MEWLIKGFSAEMIAMFTQLGLTKLANKFRDKDDNETGTDDAIANICTSLVPVVPAMLNGSESLKRRVMLGAYNAFGNYLGFSEKSLKD